MFTVQVVGLAYFNVCESCDKMALVPNGMNPGGDIAPHYCSFFIETDDLVSDSWWRNSKFDRTVTIAGDQGQDVDRPLYEFRIPEPAEIRFPVKADDALDISNLETGLPVLKQIDPRFELDEDQPDAIARFAVAGGKLQAYNFEGRAPVVQWTLASDGDVFTIEVISGNETLAISVKAGAEIVLSNMQDMINPVDADGNHFAIYARLNKSRRADGLTPPDSVNAGLQPLPYTHTFLKFLVHRSEYPEPYCGPVCC